MTALRYWLWFAWGFALLVIAGLTRIRITIADARGVFRGYMNGVSHPSEGPPLMIVARVSCTDPGRGGRDCTHFVEARYTDKGITWCWGWKSRTADIIATTQALS